jgi:hypothetical protein
MLVRIRYYKHSWIDRLISSHRSRLGCRQCKARHVKVMYLLVVIFKSLDLKTHILQCDELKPCSNCARHGVPCSLVIWDSKAPPMPAASSSSSSSNALKQEGQPTVDPPTSVCICHMVLHQQTDQLLGGIGRRFTVFPD